MKILLSAYSCEPGKGSEPGAGFSLVRAASELGECWVMTRGNSVELLRSAFAATPSAHPVHLIGVDGPRWTLALKRRFGVVHAYYALWQAVARRRARQLDAQVGGFDIVHHATMSAFWMPVGVVGMPRPLVIGPVSGGTFTPRRLVPYLGLRGGLKDGIRMLAALASSVRTRRKWKSVDVVIAQNREMMEFARRRLVSKGTRLMKHSHATEPHLEDPGMAAGRVPEVLFVGRIVRWKGVLLAVEAFARAEVDDARLVIIGEGPDGAAARRRAESLGVADRVDFTGGLARDDVLARMRAASCLLFPSFHDSAGFVVSEALTLGLPVVCLDHGGPGELVRMWPDAESVAIPPGPRSQTADRLAAAITDFVRTPRPVPTAMRESSAPLQGLLREAYGLAQGRSR